MDELEELYQNICYIFNNENLINKSIKENLFKIDYIKIFVLLVANFKLCTVPNNILSLCIDGEISDEDYEEMYNFISDKWYNNAKIELENIINDIENGVEL